MSDLISRQAAMDAIEELISARLNWKSNSSGERQGLNAAMCAIEDLPSAQPEPKIDALKPRRKDDPVLERIKRGDGLLPLEIEEER